MNSDDKTSLLSVALVQAKETLLSFYRPLLRSHDLTEQQWRIINTLAQEEQTDFQVLAQKTCILRPSLTGILNRLEKMSLITRHKPATDQRKVLIKLSTKGTNIHKKVTREIAACHQQFVSAFGAKNQNDLLSLLNKINKIAQNDSTEK